MPMPQGYVKARLAIEGGDTIQVLFNPTEYTITKGNNWTFDPIKGNSLPKGKFGGGKPREMQVNLLLDQTLPNGGMSVKDITDKLFKMMDVKATSGAGAGDAVPAARVLPVGRDDPLQGGLYLAHRRLPALRAERHADPRRRQARAHPGRDRHVRVEQLEEEAPEPDDALRGRARRPRRQGRRHAPVARAPDLRRPEPLAAHRRGQRRRQPPPPAPRHARSTCPASADARSRRPQVARGRHDRRQAGAARAGRAHRGAQLHRAAGHGHVPPRRPRGRGHRGAAVQDRRQGRDQARQGRRRRARDDLPGRDRRLRVRVHDLGGADLLPRLRPDAPAPAQPGQRGLPGHDDLGHRPQGHAAPGHLDRDRRQHLDRPQVHAAEHGDGSRLPEADRRHGQLRGRRHRRQGLPREAPQRRGHDARRSPGATTPSPSSRG